MFSHPHVRSALLSSLVTLLLLLMIAGFPGSSVGQATTLSEAAAAPAPAAQPCDVVPPFSASNFPSVTLPPKTGASTMYPLVPGTQYILDGFINDGTGLPAGHRVIFIVTDLTKVINGVRTVVLWDRDFLFNTSTQKWDLREAELAFHALDNFDNPWNLGEYPANIFNDQFVDAPDTWFSGLKSHPADPAAQGGWVLPGPPPQVGTQTFLQAYAKGIIGDCGIVSAVGVQNVCNNNTTHLCYNDVTVVDETSPPEAGTQKKYYAPGVGNFKVGAINNDPQNETLELTQHVQLSLNDCIAARNAALALEYQATYTDTTQLVYKQTMNPPTNPPTYSPMEPSAPDRSCEGNAPTATPTPTATATPLPGTLRNAYLPLAAKALPSPTPTVPPEFYDYCQSDPNPAAASNYPVRIVKVDKVKEEVTLENVSNAPVLVDDWNLCSINGNQDHDQIAGTIAAHSMRTFPNTGTPGIWNDTQRDDAALYNAFGVLVSYWVDQ